MLGSKQARSWRIYPSGRVSLCQKWGTLQIDASCTNNLQREMWKRWVFLPRGQRTIKLSAMCWRMHPSRWPTPPIDASWHNIRGTWSGCTRRCLPRRKWTSSKKWQRSMRWVQTTDDSHHLAVYFFPGEPTFLRRVTFFFGRSVTARIGFVVDSDLHEKLLHRIGSRWSKNHVELDLYVFCFRSIFCCFPFRMNLLSIQKHWVQYYMVRQSYKIGSILHVKLDLDVLIQFYISRFKFRWLYWIYKDRARPGWGRRWARALPSQIALCACSLHCALAARACGLRCALAAHACGLCVLAASAKNIWIHTW